MEICAVLELLARRDPPGERARRPPACPRSWPARPPTRQHPGKHCIATTTDGRKLFNPGTVFGSQLELRFPLASHHDRPRVSHPQSLERQAFQANHGAKVSHPQFCAQGHCRKSLRRKGLWGVPPRNHWSARVWPSFIPACVPPLPRECGRAAAHLWECGLSDEPIAGQGVARVTVRVTHR